jgi:hypothetical protein
MICLSRSVRFVRAIDLAGPAMLNSQPCPSRGDLPAYTSFAIVATGNFTKVVQRVPITIVFFRNSLVSIGCGRDSRQSSPFIPATLEDGWTVINERFC